MTTIPSVDSGELAPKMVTQIELSDNDHSPSKCLVSLVRGVPIIKTVVGE
jgi:hypothetical protein